MGGGGAGEVREMEVEKQAVVVGKWIPETEVKVGKSFLVNTGASMTTGIRTEVKKRTRSQEKRRLRSQEHGVLKESFIWILK